jgi:hypothetical protein
MSHLGVQALAESRRPTATAHLARTCVMDPGVRFGSRDWTFVYAYAR